MSENNQFSWIEFYEEFADILLTYKDKRQELINIIKQVYTNTGIKMPTLERNADGSNELVDIDPFTVFGLFNKQISDENRIRIISSIKNLFSVKADIPDSFNGIPVLNNMSATFYYFISSNRSEEMRNKNDIQNLWSLFENAILLSENDTETNRENFGEYFNAVKNQKGVRWNLTMGLFWIRPKRFLNLDSRNRWFIKNNDGLPDEFADRISKLKSVPSADEYLMICDECLSIIHSDNSAYNSIVELSYSAWLVSKQDDEYEKTSEDIKSKSLTDSQNEDVWYPNNYDPSLTEKEWLTLLNDKTVFTVGALEIMKRIKDYGGMATCSQLAEKYGEKKNFYNSGSVALARRIVKATNTKPETREDDSVRWWSILYTGRLANNEENGSIVWKLREELSKALDKIDMSNINLYASITSNRDECAYWWLNANPRVWRFSSIAVGEVQNYTLYNENGNKRRIFQNFLDAKKGDMIIGYESTPVKQVSAILQVSEEEDGEKIFFEKVCDIPIPIKYSELYNCPELANMEYLNNPQGSLFKLTKSEYDFIISKINEQNSGSTNSATYYTKSDFLSDVYISESEYDTITALLKRKKNIILQGAPGVGKTFCAKRLAWSVIGEKNNDLIKIVQFHQSYSYEDFIMGYRPNNEGGFDLTEGAFIPFCEKARNDTAHNYYFIIDEINRGNLSKIFGELLMLIESDKRGNENTINLVYGNKPFYIPDNLYLIGMMNTADRSLAMIDYALRRRFAFFEMKPAFESGGFRKYQESLSNKKFNDLINCIISLNQTITYDETLGEGFCIGHSYFCNLEEIDDKALSDIVEYEIIPMLKEYWFDEPAKVRDWSERLRSAVK